MYLFGYKIFYKKFLKKVLTSLILYDIIPLNKEKGAVMFSLMNNNNNNNLNTSCMGFIFVVEHN